MHQNIPKIVMFYNYVPRAFQDRQFSFIIETPKTARKDHFK